MVRLFCLCRFSLSIVFFEGRGLALTLVPGGVSHHDPAGMLALVSREPTLSVDRKGKHSRHHCRLETRPLEKFTLMFTNIVQGLSVCLAAMTTKEPLPLFAPLLQLWSGTAIRETSRRRSRRCRRSCGPCPRSRPSLFAACSRTVPSAGSLSPLRWSTSACSSPGLMQWVSKWVPPPPISLCISKRLWSPSERPYYYIPSVVLHFSAPPSSSIHHCPWCSPWVAKQGSSRTTLHYLLVLSVSVTQHEAVHLSAHRVEHISTCSMWMGAPCVPIHMLISFPSRGRPPPAELDCPSCFTWKHFGF